MKRLSADNPRDSLTTENRDLRIKLSTYCLKMNKERDLLVLKQEQLKEHIRDYQRQEEFWRKMKRKESSERKTAGQVKTAAENRKAFREHILREMRSTSSHRDESAVRLEDETERATGTRYDEPSPLLTTKYQHFTKDRKVTYGMSKTEQSNEKILASPESKIYINLPNSSIDSKSQNYSSKTFNAVTRVLFKQERDNTASDLHTNTKSSNLDIAIQTEDKPVRDPPEDSHLTQEKSTQTFNSPNFVLGMASKGCQTEEVSLKSLDRSAGSKREIYQTTRKKQKVFFNNIASKSKDSFINISNLISLNSRFQVGEPKTRSTLKTPLTNKLIKSLTSLQGKSYCLNSSLSQTMSNKKTCAERISSQQQNVTNSAVRKSTSFSQKFAKMKPIMGCSINFQKRFN